MTNAFSSHEPYARALGDYHAGARDALITLYSSLGEHESLPVALFFRDAGGLFPFEQAALEHCRGAVLDAGAGTGVHSLILQERGLDVTALEIVPELVSIMRDRGVRNAVHDDFWTYEGGPFDTMIMMMNGPGAFGTLDGLDRFFREGPRLLKRSGRVILDSAAVERADPTGASIGMEWPQEPAAYIGESWIRLEYEGQRGKPFRELYVDHTTLEAHARRAGWRCDLVFLDSGAYTAILRPRNGR